MTFKTQIIKSKKINGLLQILPSSHKDQRGQLYSFFDDDIIKSILPKKRHFNHLKIAQTNTNSLRGIHGDFTSWKLVTCLHGNIFQVALDNRVNSTTYLNSEEFNLNSSKPSAILLPPGVGNGFYAFDDCVYGYSLSYNGEYNDFDQQFTIRWNDPKHKIKWPNIKPILSDRDKQ